MKHHKLYFPKHVADPTRFEGHVCSGLKGTGKSTLAERLAEWYYRNGYIIFDCLDGNDLEALFWGVPGRNGDYYRTLLIHPPTYKIQHTNQRFHHIKPMCSDVGLETILRTAQQEKRIVTVACKLWNLGTVGNLLSKWFYELPEVADRIKTPIFLLAREIGNYAFSQLSVFEALEKEFRKSVIYLMRTGRHHRIAFFFDLQRQIDLHRGIRTICDHIFLKKTNKRALPSELHWVLDEINTWRAKFRQKANGGF